MAKYSKHLTEHICALIEDGEMTISDICKAFKITRQTFYDWKTHKPEFQDALHQALRHRNDKLASLARETIRRKLNGYKTQEIRTTYIPNKANPNRMEIQKQVIIEKEHLPDASTLNLILKHAFQETEQELAAAPTQRPFIIEVINQETKLELEKLQRGERATSDWEEQEQEDNPNQEQPTEKKTKKTENPTIEQEPQTIKTKEKLTPKPKISLSGTHREHQPAAPSHDRSGDTLKIPRRV